MPDITKIDLAAFKIAIGELEKSQLTDDAKSVIGKMKEGVQFLEMGIKEDEEAFFVATVGSNSKGLLRMTKRNGVWYIDDLVSAAKGCGGALARAGIDYATRDYGVVPNQTIELISLSEKSTSFWEHYGFKTKAGIELRRSVGMTLTLPNEPSVRDVMRTEAAKRRKAMGYPD